MRKIIFALGDTLMDNTFVLQAKYHDMGVIVYVTKEIQRTEVRHRHKDRPHDANKN